MLSYHSDFFFFPTNKKLLLLLSFALLSSHCIKCKKNIFPCFLYLIVFIHLLMTVKRGLYLVYRHWTHYFKMVYWNVAEPSRDSYPSYPSFLVLLWQYTTLSCLSKSHDNSCNLACKKQLSLLVPQCPKERDLSLQATCNLWFTHTYFK